MTSRYEPLRGSPQKPIVAKPKRAEWEWDKPLPEPKPKAKPKPTFTVAKPKPKPKKRKRTKTEYVVHVENHEPFYVSEYSKTFHASVFKDGFFDGTAWHPPHRIVKVEPRGKA